MPSHPLLVLIAAIFGLLIGSFLNVCIYRLPRDLSVVAPRSFCPECGASISWHDNIPVLSFFALRRHCRNCAQPIGWRYPLVELATSAAFALVASRYRFTAAGLKWVVFESLLVILFCTDLEERILPDELTLGGTLAGFVFAFFVPVHGLLFEMLLPRMKPALLSVLIATFTACLLSLPLWGIAKLYERVRNQADAFGLGDLKLLALMGMFLGFDAGVSALLIGSIAGALFGVVYVLITRQNWRTATLPFGSFLCFGAAIVPLLTSL